MKYKDKRKCHVRFNRKAKHPSAIIGEENDNYLYKGLSHKNYRNRKIKLYKNPNPDDEDECYIDKKAHLKEKRVFGKKKKGWSFSKKDYPKL